MYGCIGIAVKQMGISSLEELWFIQKRWYFQSQDLKGVLVKKNNVKLTE
ncbi:hypothetical protein HMPREF9724_01284 [Treponema denticola SP37]|nr:hypothetical protein HMPREF9724_01284 [Treponema denticola SP37]EPF34967.1 hypothetical protein HMPREF9734_00513 [Treponema denticola SP44]EPF38890.1 hypothetical protein HMPREF9731_02142 [Treponema denticola SP23]